MSADVSRETLVRDRLGEVLETVKGWEGEPHGPSGDLNPAFITRLRRLAELAEELLEAEEKISIDSFGYSKTTTPYADWYHEVQGGETFAICMELRQVLGLPIPDDVAEVAPIAIRMRHPEAGI